LLPTCCILVSSVPHIGKNPQYLIVIVWINMLFFQHPILVKWVCHRRTPRNKCKKLDNPTGRPEIPSPASSSSWSAKGGSPALLRGAR
jgi:hypothetical protein